MSYLLYYASIRGDGMNIRKALQDAHPTMDINMVEKDVRVE